MNDCIFCKIISGTIPSKFELNEENIIAINDISPKAPVHLLIIPKEHIPQISDVKASQLTILGELVDAARRVAEKKKVKDYRLIFNNGAGAGQSVFHIHLHILGGRPMHWPPG